MFQENNAVNSNVERAGLLFPPRDNVARQEPRHFIHNQLRTEVFIYDIDPRRNNNYKASSKFRVDRVNKERADGCVYNLTNDQEICSIIARRRTRTEADSRQHDDGNERVV